MLWLFKYDQNRTCAKFKMTDDMTEGACHVLQIKRCEDFKARQKKVGSVGKLVLTLQSGQFEDWLPHVTDVTDVGNGDQSEEGLEIITVLREVLNGNCKWSAPSENTLK